jgi:putative ATP-dependent endonuclease of OLD family
LGADLTEHGVSVVNVGGTGLRRFSKVFQRFDKGSPPISVPVACVADMDVMPDCAPVILGLVTGDDDVKWQNPRRRWKATRDFIDENKSTEKRLKDRRNILCSSDSKPVRTFVADHWTLEYDLAFCGLAEDVYVAAILAKNDDAIMTGNKSDAEVQTTARTEFQHLAEKAGNDQAVLSSHIYGIFHSGDASKAIGAQYLANILVNKGKEAGFNSVAFKKKLPSYIVHAIAYATGEEGVVPPADGAPTTAANDTNG